jgi:hypothetical protein
MLRPRGFRQCRAPSWFYQPFWYSDKCIFLQAFIEYVPAEEEFGRLSYHPLLHPTFTIVWFIATSLVKMVLVCVAELVGWHRVNTRFSVYFLLFSSFSPETWHSIWACKWKSREKGFSHLTNPISSHHYILYS